MKTGTYEWALKTQGSLNPWQNWSQLAQAIWRQLKRQLTTVHPGMVDLADVMVPDSSIARRAAEFCHEILSPQLANHCLRTYFFGQIIARVEHRKPDAELLFLSSVLHDAGLSDRYFHQQAGCSCFAAAGAIVAENHLLTGGYPQDLARKVANAICLHLNVSVSAHEFGDEAYLLREAAGLDIAGIGLQRVHSRNRVEVLRLYPRTNEMITEVTGKLESEAQKFPRSRTAFLNKFGFVRMIRDSGRTL
jgi:hypothetical protein